MNAVVDVLRWRKHAAAAAAADDDDAASTEMFDVTLRDCEQRRGRNKYRLRAHDEGSEIWPTAATISRFDGRWTGDGRLTGGHWAAGLGRCETATRDEETARRSAARRQQFGQQQPRVHSAFSTHGRTKQTTG